VQLGQVLYSVWRDKLYLSWEFDKFEDYYESLDVLRLARTRRELTREEYTKLRKDIFEKGKEASLVRKDLTAIIKERKKIDPQQARENRQNSSVRRLMAALRSFKKDMETLKLADPDIIEEADELLERLEGRFSNDPQAH
jgi:hypothetical protein